MSRAAKFTLAATGLGTAGIVWFVHWSQEADRAVSLHAPGQEIQTLNLGDL